MAVFELILCIIAAVVVSSFVSRFVPKVSTPLVQIVLGVLVTYLPFFPDATLDPELFMVLFIAPLLYLEAHEIDKSALLKNAGSEPIAGYRTGYRHDGGGRIHFACRLAVHHLSLSLSTRRGTRPDRCGGRQLPR